jgi:hypothetical protein
MDSFVLLRHTMTDWTDILGDTISQIAQSFMDSNRPKRLIGVAFIAITAFGILGTCIAVACVGNLGAAGFSLLIPTLIATTLIALYCFATDRGPEDS